jgi:UDP-glucose 4-epimerase
MRILITGGFGFIGGRVAKFMQSLGHEIVLGTRSTGKRADWLPSAEIVITTWTDTVVLETICKNVDVVIHTAGMNAIDCESDPVAALHFNGFATARLAQAAAIAGVKRFIYLSTAHVYAAPLVGEIHEGVPVRNTHPYATSHLAGEKAVLDVGERHSMSTLVLRLSNAFGEPVHEETNCWMLLVQDLCRQAVTNGEMKLHTAGFQQRDFIPMTEVCMALNKLLEDVGSTVPYDVVNLGAGASIKVRKMAEIIKLTCKSSLGFDPRLIMPELKIHEVAEQLTYSCDRLQQLHISVNPDPSNEINKLLQFCHHRLKLKN